jgi:hypothetical protein
MDRETSQQIAVKIAAVLQGQDVNDCVPALTANLKFCLEQLSDRISYERMVAQVVGMFAPGCVVEVFEHREVANDG